MAARGRPPSDAPISRSSIAIRTRPVGRFLVVAGVLLIARLRVLPALALAPQRRQRPEATVPAGTSITIHITGQGATGNKIPTSISAVTVNLLAISTTNNGYLTALPDHTTRPGTSNLNYI